MSSPMGPGYFYSPPTGITNTPGGGLQPVIETVFQIQLTLTSAQLLSMYGSPVQLLAPCGNGTMFQLLFATLEYNPGGTDYTVGAVNNFFIGPASAPTSLNTLQPVPATLVNGTGGPGQVIAATVPANVVTANQSAFNNQAIVITHDGGSELVSGNGTLTVTLYFVSTSC